MEDRIDLVDGAFWGRNTPERVRAQEDSIRRTARLLIDALAGRETFGSSSTGTTAPLTSS